MNWNGRVFTLVGHILAARIEGLAEPGGVFVSGTVYEQVQSKAEHAFEDLGYQRLKNITQSVRVYALKLSDSPVKEGRGLFIDTLADKGPSITGGCLCGEVRYEAQGEELGSAYCHSPQIVEAWESAGVKISDYPRNVNVSEKA